MLAIFWEIEQSGEGILVTDRENLLTPETDQWPEH